jgi:hypothetical protein
MALTSHSLDLLKLDSCYHSVSYSTGLAGKSGTAIEQVCIIEENWLLNTVKHPTFLLRNEIIQIDI